MTDQLSPLAVQNVGLLRALRIGPAESPAALAERAGIVPNNLHRKLDALEAEGLIVRCGDAPKHLADLTAAAERALVAIDVYEGRAAAGESSPLTVGGVSYLPLARLKAWPGNPRRHIAPKSVLEMAQSVADRGVETPITVRACPEDAGEGFEVLFGQRRYLGTLEAVRQGWVSGDHVLIPCMVRDLSDEEAETAAGVENLQREDMHWADLAKYFLHMMDVRRLSGPQLERMFGGRNYSARKIQDYAKIARELPEDVFAQAYLPAFLDPEEKRANPAHLTYTKARDLVGDKQERPALDLAPRLRLALLELLLAGEQEGRTVIARLHAPPNGGPLMALQDRKLIGFGFAGREVVCRIPMTEDLARFLQQIGWYEDDAATLRAARIAVAGEMQTDALEPGEYVTAELNAPKAGPIIARTNERPDEADPGDPVGGFDHDDQPAPSAPAAAPDEPTPPAALEAPKLPPMLQIVLIELAHRIATRGHERTPGAWAVEVQANYYKDQRGMQLVQQHRMVKFVAAGLKTVAMINEAGLSWLEQNAGVWQVESGRPSMTDDDLLTLQRDLAFKAEGGPYSTAWLNDPEPEPAAAPAREAPAEAPADPAPRRDAFSLQVLNVTAEARCIGRMAAALREARLAIRVARSNKLTAAQVSQMEALIDGALEAATPHLAEEPAHA